jgi:hypothetical protein
VQSSIDPVCFGFLQLLATKSCCRSSNASAFQPAFVKIALVKTFQNQYEHKIGRIVTIVEICSFLDLEPFRPLHLPPHVMHTIFRFFPQSDSLHSQILRKNWSEKKLNQTPHVASFLLYCTVLYYSMPEALASTLRSGRLGARRAAHRGLRVERGC